MFLQFVVVAGSTDHILRILAAKAAHARGVLRTNECVTAFDNKSSPFLAGDRKN